MYIFVWRTRWKGVTTKATSVKLWALCTQLLMHCILDSAQWTARLCENPDFPRPSASQLHTTSSWLLTVCASSFNFTLHLETFTSTETCLIWLCLNQENSYPTGLLFTHDHSRQQNCKERHRCLHYKKKQPSVLFITTINQSNMIWFKYESNLM